MNFNYLGFDFKNIDFGIQAKGSFLRDGKLLDQWEVFTSNELPYEYLLEDNKLVVDLPSQVRGLYFYLTEDFWQKLGYANSEPLPYYYEDNQLIVQVDYWSKGKSIKFWQKLGFANAVSI